MLYLYRCSYLYYFPNCFYLPLEILATIFCPVEDARASLPLLQLSGRECPLGARTCSLWPSARWSSPFDLPDARASFHGTRVFRRSFHAWLRRARFWCASGTRGPKLPFAKLETGKTSFSAWTPSQLKTPHLQTSELKGWGNVEHQQLRCELGDAVIGYLIETKSTLGVVTFGYQIATV